MRAVVLFARSPEREAAAKRMPSAAPLFRAVIAAWLRAAHAHDAMPVIACEPRDRESLASIAPALGRCWIEQRPGAFGTRVADAVAATFVLGYDAVLLAAIDAPPSDLGAAFGALDEGRAVIAPARDGGVNFIGLTSPNRALLEQLAPHRRDLVALCERHLDRVVVLETTTDVDSPSSLKFARHEKAWRPYFPVLQLHPATPFRSDLPVVTSPLPSRAPPA
ncbi:MAG TPA: DUF2064 domain-containing protein [Thermoanaerobaculia bacterium]|nr:DUF2064 domain-containing protein [Thermoanaerobaculia bacterium]